MRTKWYMGTLQYVRTRWYMGTLQYVRTRWSRGFLFTTPLPPLMVLKLPVKQT